MAFVALAAATTARAQAIATADSLLAAGALSRAESLYYAAAAARPRDPAARWALGRFLLERGAARVAASLLQESLQFGGDPVLVGRDLARAYLEAGEYAPLAGVAAASPAQRERARWLAVHEPRVVAPDSIVEVPLGRSGDSASFGTIELRIAGASVTASIDAVARGVVISRSALRGTRLHEFALSADSGVAAAGLTVADSLAIGRLLLLNEPVTLANLPGGVQAVVGLSALGRFAPTVDATAGRLVLRVGGSVNQMPPGERAATLDRPSGISALRNGEWMPLAADPLLRQRRWTFDARHGTLIVER